MPEPVIIGEEGEHYKVDIGGSPSWMRKEAYHKRYGVPEQPKGRMGEQDEEEIREIIDREYQKGRMSEEEYEQLGAELFETTRAQFGHIRRGEVERGYGEMALGTLRGRLRDIDVAEVGEITRGRRELFKERAGRRTEAGGRELQARLDLMRIRQQGGYGGGRDVTRTVPGMERRRAISGEPEPMPRPGALRTGVPGGGTFAEYAERGRQASGLVLGRPSQPPATPRWLQGGAAQPRRPRRGRVY